MTTISEGSTDLPDSERQTYTVRETAAVMGLSLGVTYALLRQGRLPGCGLASAGGCPGSSWLRSWPRSRGTRPVGCRWTRPAPSSASVSWPSAGGRRGRSS
jgi:hypothetical protein